MLTKKKKAVAISLIVLLAVVVLAAPLVIYMHTDAYMMSMLAVTRDYKIPEDKVKIITIEEYDKNKNDKKYVMTVFADNDNNLSTSSTSTTQAIENGYVINSTITNSINQTLWALGNKIRITNDELIMLDSGIRCPITGNKIKIDRGNGLFINDGSRYTLAFSADVTELFKNEAGAYTEITDVIFGFTVSTLRTEDSLVHRHCIDGLSLYWTLVNKNNNTTHYFCLKIQKFTAV